MSSYSGQELRQTQENWDQALGSSTGQGSDPAATIVAWSQPLNHNLSLSRASARKLRKFPCLRVTNSYQISQCKLSLQRIVHLENTLSWSAEPKQVSSYFSGRNWGKFQDGSYLLGSYSAVTYCNMSVYSQLINEYASEPSNLHINEAWAQKVETEEKRRSRMK